MVYSVFEDTLIDKLSQTLNRQITSSVHPLRSYYENNPFPEKLFYRDTSYNGFLSVKLEHGGELKYVQAYAAQMLGFGFNAIIFLDSDKQTKAAFWDAMCVYPEEKLVEIFGHCLKTYSYMMYDKEVKKSNTAISLMVQQYIDLAGEYSTNPNCLCIFNKLMFFVGVAIATDQQLSSIS